MHIQKTRVTLVASVKRNKEVGTWEGGDLILHILLYILNFELCDCITYSIIIIQIINGAK